MCPVLTDIYNSSLKQGYVPAQLKESVVWPMPKVSPPKSVDSDLRPILLLLRYSVAKIMEGLNLHVTLYFRSPGHWTLLC